MLASTAAVRRFTKRMPTTLCRLTLFTGAACGALPAQSPCGLAALPGPAYAGANGGVGVLEPWDPDGPGPLPRLVVAGGRFRVIGNASSQNIAAYEPQTRTWLPIGGGIAGGVTAIATRANGNLVAASLQATVHEWNGTTWQQLGGVFGSFSGTGVACLIEASNGELVAGGLFQAIGTAPIHGIARWDGVSWQPMGAPTVPWSLGNVQQLVKLPNGDLAAAGLFTQIGGIACTLVARWDGTSWSPFGQGAAVVPWRLIVDANGDLVAGGQFATPTGTTLIARWNGSAWLDLSPGLPIIPNGIAALPNGDVLAFGAGGAFAGGLAGWSPFAPWTASQNTSALAVSATDVLAAGTFVPTANVPTHNIARWNGAAWQATTPGSGSDGPISAVAVRPDGSLLVAGNFHHIAGQPANRLALLAGGVWQPIASSAINTVRLAQARPDGEVVLVGEFPNTTTGGMDFVMRWNGGAVTPIYGGLWGTRIVRCVALASNGDALLGYSDLATFSSGIARWDGATLTFAPVASTLLNALVELPNGDIAVAGFFSQFATPSLARWTGTQLLPFGTPLAGTVLSLARTPNGELIAGGSFPSPPRIARWDGAAWQPLGSGAADPVSSIAVLPDGDVLTTEQRNSAAGWDTRVRRFDGTAWTSLSDAPGRIQAAWTPSGAAMLYGDFAEFAGQAHANLVLLPSTCPAFVIDRGGGCSSGVGPLLLTTTEGAWLGTRLRSRCRGLASPTLAVASYGFAAVNVPLAQLSPLGAFGCALLATPDLLALAPTSFGEANAEFAIPNTLALVGAAFEHQFLAVELDATGSASALRSSNALRLVIGAL
jgi:trimeric autotransporter adhesin